MIRINGPTQVVVLESNKNIIILFGDIHANKEGACKGCKRDKNCSDIITFINKVRNDTDIFIEAPNESGLEYIKEWKEDYLLNLWKEYNTNMYSHKQLEIGKRFHYTDIRNSMIHLFNTNVSLKYGIDTLYKYYVTMRTIRLFDNYVKFERYVDAMVYSNDFKKSITKIFGEENVNWILTEIVLKTIQQGTKTRHVHPIRKQILKLSTDDREILFRYHINVLEDHRRRFSRIYNRERKLYLLKNQKTNELLGMVLFNVRAHIMDMYHLARMLYYKNKNEILISYTGQVHTEQYRSFFKHYYKMEEKYEYSKNKGCEDDNKVIRCVQFPKEIYKQIIK